MFFPYVNVTINVVNFTQKGEKTSHSVFIYFMFEKNTKQVNRIMAKLFAVATLAILILVIFSYLGIFEFGKEYTLIILIAGLIITLSPSILIHYLSDNAMRYYMIILAAIFIGVLGTNNHIGVYITYALVPVYSCLYFEPAFTIKSSILAYISMVISVYVNSASKYEVVYQERPRMQIAIAYILGFTIEYVIVCVILYFVVRRAKQMMEERYSAEAENRMKSEFLSKMSHEIRTPMNAIIGMSDVALRKDMDDELRHYITIIKSSSTGLLEIINDILDLSKVEAGKVSIITDTYSTQALVDDITAIIDARNIDKKVPIYYHIQKEMPPYLEGDVVRIKQVMLNYASNAIKYTSSGQIDVTIRCGVYKDNPREKNELAILTFTVKDTGQGIRKEDLSQLFKMYGQVDSKKNYGKEGTGIGLAISKYFIEEMGGTVRVDSTYGKGSTFSFMLPQKLVSAPALDERTGCDTASVSSKENTSDIDTVSISSKEIQNKSDTTFTQSDKTYTGISDTSSPQALSRLQESDFFAFTAPDSRILLVDDNDINREVVKAMLEPIHLIIDEACDGQEAVNMSAKTAYALILMDSHMPVMNGEEATALIRKREKVSGQHTPIIALTADAISGVREHLLQCGMDDYIEKPIDSGVLFKTLKKYLVRS